MRAATGHDLDTLVALDRACFGAGAWSRDSLDADLRRAYDPGDRHVALALVDATAVGHLILLLAGDTADLTRVGVVPGRRRRGLGTQLVRYAQDVATDRACERMLLEVEASNVAARAVYDVLGFTALASRRDYYGPGRDAVVLERTLHR